MATTVPTRRARLWRRRLLRAALCVLLGAVTTVGVAWGAPAVLLLTPAPAGTGSVDVVANGQQVVVNWQHTRLSSYADLRVGPAAAGESHVQAVPESILPERIQQAARDTADALPSTDFASLPISQTLRLGWAVMPRPHDEDEVCNSTWRIGWPLKALGAEAWSQRAADGSYARSGERGWLRPENWSWIPPGVKSQWLFEAFGGPRIARPLLPGFLIDSLFYAVPWWALLVTPGLVKRWRRKRRGACVACGYDLRGLGDGATCPECGT